MLNDLKPGVSSQKPLLQMSHEATIGTVSGDGFGGEEKGGTVQNTSVGLHSRDVIPAISVGNISALPAGSPSGGVRVGAAANAMETDVQSWGSGGRCFSPSNQSPPCLQPAWKARSR